MPYPANVPASRRQLTALLSCLTYLPYLTHLPHAPSSPDYTSLSLGKVSAYLILHQRTRFSPLQLLWKYFNNINEREKVTCSKTSQVTSTNNKFIQPLIYVIEWHSTAAAASMPPTTTATSRGSTLYLLLTARTESF